MSARQKLSDFYRSSTPLTKRRDKSRAKVAGVSIATAATALSVAGVGLGAYHGYKRDGSVGWALAWAALGGLFPIVTIPVAIAQGFAQPGPAPAALPQATV